MNKALNALSKYNASGAMPIANKCGIISLGSTVPELLSSNASNSYLIKLLKLLDPAPINFTPCFLSQDSLADYIVFT